MTDERTYVGGSDRSLAHLLLFLGGVVLGSVVRLIEWLVPVRIEQLVKRLLP